jgi:hypothetical protein
MKRTGISTTSFAGKKSRRRSIWQINSSFHCSIVGICLRRRDLRALSRKKLFLNQCKDFCDYQIHSYLVGAITTRSDQSRALGKFLDAKYRLALKRYAAAADEEAIEALWREDFAAGTIAGAYWAIMTHSMAEGKVVGKVYGQCHLLGYDFFGDYKRDIRAMENLQNQLSTLEIQLDGERHQHNLQLKDVQQECSVLREEMQDIQARYAVRQDLSPAMVSDAAQARSALERQLEETWRRREQELVGENERLAAEYRKVKKQLEESVNKLQSHDKKLMVARAEIAELRVELNSIEGALFDYSSVDSCVACADLDSCRCPGRDLCGKTVLYVGGQHKMISRYRDLVEKFGGRFLHHDGGKEDARRLLPQLLGGADMVFCPVDCVSHDACRCVKNMCKHYQKPFVMMRSSGLSSLAKELSKVTQ